ncbi:MAG: winged helix DNA-binding protein [Dehalococcoidales bacterium]|nr:winged helix DNA-binding protein [Dehalococcoidales bacterium]
MKNSTLSDADYNLYRLLAQTRTMLSRVREKELYRYGILARHAAALQAIQAIGDKATPAEVSRWLCREPHTISSLLVRMEEKDLIKKTKDLDKRNLVRITLTEKGLRAYERTTERKSIHELLSSLSKKEQQRLMALLEKLRSKAMGKLGIEYRIPYDLNGQGAEEADS